jgi:hypothetical protein
MTTKTVAPLRSHDHRPATGAEQTAAWGQVIPSRWPPPLLKLLDGLVERRQRKAGNASTYNKGELQRYYEYNDPESEALNKVLGVSYRNTRNIGRSSILHDLVVAAAARNTRPTSAKKKKKGKAKKGGGKR